MTGSCLAFAPRTKTGSNNQATQKDWQAETEDDFVKLEPWAVPCGAEWIKDHWDKWQGYSFYSVGTSIEKCVTVTFELNMQPVVAFVGGVTFDLLPGPLASIDSTARALYDRVMPTCDHLLGSSTVDLRLAAVMRTQLQECSPDSDFLT